MFAKRLKQTMLERKLSIPQVAHLAEISVPTIRSILYGNGGPTLFTATCIADALGLSLDWLAGRTEEPGGTTDGGRVRGGRKPKAYPIEEPDLNTFAVRLQEARLAKGWGLSQAAAAFGTAYSSYRGWERGLHQPSLSGLIRAAQVYGVSIDWLAGLSDDKGGKETT